MISCALKFASIVVDVDLTLVWSTLIKRQVRDKPYHQITFKSYDKTENITGYVVIRPHARTFLKTLTQKYKVGLWSIGKPDYILAVMAVLNVKVGTQDSSMESQCGIDCMPEDPIYVDFIYDWSHCYRDGPRVYKPLKYCPFSDDAIQKRCCIIEDSIDACDISDPHIIVSPFKGDPHDIELLSLLEQF